jgi:hypothetical protein
MTACKLHREQRSRVYLVEQDKRRLTLLIVISFIVESPCMCALKMHILQFGNGNGSGNGLLTHL